MININEVDSEENIIKAQRELQVWLEGRGAFLRNKPENANPYQTGTIEHEYWSDGWEDASSDLLED